MIASRLQCGTFQFLGSPLTLAACRARRGQLLLLVLLATAAQLMRFGYQRTRRDARNRQQVVIIVLLQLRDLMLQQAGVQGARTTGCVQAERGRTTCRRGTWRGCGHAQCLHLLDIELGERHGCDGGQRCWRRRDHREKRTACVLAGNADGARLLSSRG